VQDHHLERLDLYAAALYLFLVTVANAQGLSWYSEAAITQRLPIDQAQLRHARCVLVRAGLLAFANGVYQILPLDAPMPVRLAPPAASIELVAPARPDIAAETVTPASPAKLPADPVTGHHHLATILATLRARP
jgi:hypothetical protein